MSVQRPHYTLTFTTASPSDSVPEIVRLRLLLKRLLRGYGFRAVSIVKVPADGPDAVAVADRAPQGRPSVAPAYSEDTP